MLLGYLPASKAIQIETLLRKRTEYKGFVELYFTKDDITADLSERDIKNYKQILADIPRTMTEYKLFTEPIIREVLTRILFIWSIRHPASGYVQGLNDVCCPFLITYLSEYLPLSYKVDGYNKDRLLALDKSILSNVEADTYWSLSKMVEKTQDIYTENQPRVHEIIKKMNEIVIRVDPELHNHFENQDINYVQFAFRWINCFFVREFTLDKVVRLWDTYFSESDDIGVFHEYVCASLLLHLKSEIMKKLFPGLISYLQSFPTKKWSLEELEVLLAKSYQLKTIFQKANSI